MRNQLVVLWQPVGPQRAKFRFCEVWPRSWSATARSPRSSASSVFSPDRWDITFGKHLHGCAMSTAFSVSTTCPIWLTLTQTSKLAERCLNGLGQNVRGLVPRTNRRHRLKNLVHPNDRSSSFQPSSHLRSMRLSIEMTIVGHKARPDNPHLGAGQSFPSPERT